MTKRLSLAICAGILTMLLVGMPTSSAVAQSTPVTWSASFFANPYFSGAPSLSETSNAVAYNWGSGSPAANIPNDNFSAQIATDTTFTAGTYRFYMLADDGATVRFNFNDTIFDTYRETQPGALLTSDFLVTRSGTFHIQIDYVEYDADALLYFGWERLDDGVQGPPFAIPQITTRRATAVDDTYWVGQFYNNVSLSGTPVAIIGGNGLSTNWDTSNPAPNTTADNFSARFNGAYTLEAREYRVRVEADDGVRVYFDGILIIDQWGPATGKVYEAIVTPTAGNHVFTVEYFEASGIAFLDFELAAIDSEPVSVVDFAANATITAFRLNVRSAPVVAFDNVITQVQLGKTFPIIGRTADNSWIQIDIGGTVGWISSAFAVTANLQRVTITDGSPNVPVGQSVTQPQPTGFTAFTRTEVNLREGPSTSFSRLFILPQNVSVEIVGRNTRGTWWQVRYNGTTGWASAQYAVIETENPDLGQIPITSE